MDKHLVKSVELTKRAIKDLNKIKAFNKKLLGEIKAQEIIDKIFERLSVLENSTIDLKKIGAIDKDFSHLKHQYRKLFQDYYKMTYREGRTKMFVIRVFDTRQHPNKNK